MKRLVLGVWLGFAYLACAQQSGVTPAGDVFNVNTPGGSVPAPAAALQNLYQLTAQMTADPSPGYDRQTTRWPRADQIQREWVASVSEFGNNFTQEQRRRMVPCAAHLNSAIDFMERGYRIEISQRGNMPAQLTARDLYRQGRAEFAMCNGNDTFANNNSGTQRGGAPPQQGRIGQPGGSGGQNGGGNGGTPPLQGRIGQPGGNGGQNGGGNRGGPPPQGRSWPAAASSPRQRAAGLPRGTRQRVGSPGGVFESLEPGGAAL